MSTQVRLPEGVVIATPQFRPEAVLLAEQLAKRVLAEDTKPTDVFRATFESEGGEEVHVELTGAQASEVSIDHTIATEGFDVVSGTGDGGSAI